MPYEILRDSIALEQAGDAIRFHLSVFGVEKTCRITVTALRSLDQGQGGDLLVIFDTHRLRIGQRAFSYLSRDLLVSGVVLRALDF
ncbi:hypothetical protein VM94_01373 [Janthinobacterium sp. KBS0711]|uniref:DUF1488 family protein n=1 Tax=Janthinobacterium sp. KBS0711 TaxID=1649647 RepID=UPI000627A438|nr:DUF1488 family protein [Janthinobacterium sp. KBS0711]KKO64669.1 hypothetical protein VM94_01373 [Janthinobacterium sp. KBS0711]TSD72375.1 DUF1488 domain-containing protein [Janthinobacterium sp. KBS0711]